MRVRFAAIGFLLLPAITLAQQRPLPIIDMHLHAHRLSKPGVVQRDTGLVAPDSHEELVRATVEALERYNIVRAVTSGRFVEEYRKAAPGRIIAGLSEGPQTLFTSTDEIRSWFEDGRCAVLAEIGGQYGGMAPGHPMLERFFALAEELDVPLGYHMGMGGRGEAYRRFESYRMTLSNPLLLEEVLVRHPKLRIYVMHAGWPMLDEMVGLLWAHPQVYVDVAALNWLLPRKEFHHYLRRLVEAGFGDRVMYGSDQIFWPQVIGLSIEAIEAAEFLTEQQKRDIFYNNAARFLRLTDEEIARDQGRSVGASAE